MFQALLGEYRISLNREAGYDPDRPNVSAAAWSRSRTPSLRCGSRST
jgi:hypothetical protein